MLTFIYMLLLPEGQGGKFWEPSKKEGSLGNRGVVDGRALSLVYLVPKAWHSHRTEILHPPDVP
jgi:hypothetical protein